MIHGFDEREHDEPKALGLLRIERARRGLRPALLARLGRRRAPEPGATSGQDEEDEGDNELCSHTWLRGSGCWCRANRILRRAESVADVLLRILQELFGSTQGAPASVQHFPGPRIHRPDPLRRLRAHSPDVFPRTELWICLPQSKMPTAPVIIPRMKTSPVRISFLPYSDFRYSVSSVFSRSFNPSLKNAS